MADLDEIVAKIDTAHDQAREALDVLAGTLDEPGRVLVQRIKDMLAAVDVELGLNDDTPEAPPSGYDEVTGEIPPV